MEHGLGKDAARGAIKVPTLVRYGMLSVLRILCHRDCCRKTLTALRLSAKLKQAADAAIEGAYPNPFNSSVNLRYHLKESGQVEVAIYSITGQLVRRLVSENKARPGAYSVTWDGFSDRGNQVASGMYLVRVQSPGSVKSFKLSLIR